MEEEVEREERVWRKYIIIIGIDKVAWIIICDSGAEATYNPCHFIFWLYHYGKSMLRKECVCIWGIKIFLSL